MITVAKMIEELKKFPADALCYAYEGEMQGVVVVEARSSEFANGGSSRKVLGYITAAEGEA